MLSVEDWAEIRRLCRSEGMPIKVVARVMGCSKNTVKRALAGEGPPIYQRPPRGLIVDAVEPRVRELLQAWPTMPTTVIAGGSVGIARFGCCGTGWPSCVRSIYRRTRLRGPPMPQGRSPSATGGSPTFSCRSGSASPEARPGCRYW